MNKKGICFITAALLLSGCASTAPKDPFDSVSIVSSVCELGDKDFDLINNITYEGDVPVVFVSDYGGFDPNKEGTYNVTYTITDLKDKTHTKSFDISVEDTTPPELTLNKKEIHVKKGDTVDMSIYASAVDKSESTEIKYDGDLDTEKDGEYTVKVYAEDKSGNKSDTQDVKVIVGNREDCIVRNAKFGDDRDTVKEWEDAERVEHSTLGIDDDGSLIYKDSINGIETYICYYFNKDGRLGKIGYVNGSEHMNKREYLNDFDKLEESLEKKYGEPDQKEYQKNDSADYLDEADAIKYGLAVRYIFWNKEGYLICHLLQSDDAGGITHSLQYESEGYEGVNYDENDV